MKRTTLILSMGIVLIIVATVVFGASYFMFSQRTIKLSVPASRIENYSFKLSEDGGILLMTSHSIFSYKLRDSAGNILFSGDNESRVELNLNSGNYTVELKNAGKKAIFVDITLISDEENEKMLFLTYISGGICTTGLITFLAGLVLVLWNRKREEKIYTRD